MKKMILIAGCCLWWGWILKAQMVQKEENRPLKEAEIDKLVSELEKENMSELTISGNHSSAHVLSILNNDYEDFSKSEWLHSSSGEYNGLSVEKKIKLACRDGEWDQHSRILHVKNSDGKKRFYLHSWESGKWKNKGKYIFSYNLKDQLSSYQYLKPGFGGWKNHFQNKLDYDNQGHLIAEVLQEWGNNQWVNYMAYYYEYDKDGNLMSKEIMIWKGKQWNKERKYLFSYDDQGNMTYRIYQNREKNAWVNVFRNIYTYDEKNRKITFTDQNWVSDEWLNDWKLVYNYDKNGILITLSYLGWDAYGWENVRRFAFTYDQDQVLLSELWQTWKEESWQNEWICIFRNENGKILSETWKDWVEYRWVDDRSYESEYDENGDVMAYVRYQWNGQNWEKDWRNVYTYDSGHSEKEKHIIHQVFSNPLTGKINFSFHDDNEDETELNLYDLQGNLINRVVNGHFPAGQIPHSLNEGISYKEKINKGIFLFEYKTADNFARGALIYVE